MRLLPIHEHGIISDNRIINNKTIGFTETQIKPSDCISKFIKTLNYFNINFNNNQIKKKKFSLLI